MFETLVFENLHKLIKSKVPDFTPPKAFHAVNIQCLGDNGIEPFAQICCQFPMPVFSLVRNVTVKTSQSTNGTPPVRAFDLPTQCFTKFKERQCRILKFGQRLFQRFRMLDFFTGVQCQIGIQAEVYSYTLTYRRQDFFRFIIRHYIEPVSTNPIPKDLDIPHSAMPIAMLMERKPTSVKLQLLGFSVPRLEREADTPLFKFIAWLFPSPKSLLPQFCG